MAAPALLVVLGLLYRPPRLGELRRWSVDFAGALAPSVLAGTLYVALRTRAIEALFAVQHVRLSENPLVVTDGIERIATSLAVAGRYAGLLLFPRTLSPDYSGNVVHREPSFLAFLPIAGALFLFVMLALAAAPLLFRRREETEPWRALSMGALLFLLPYLVIGNVFVLVGVVMAERMIYLPSAGLCLVAGVGLGAMLARASSYSGRAAGGVRIGIVLLGTAVVLAGTLKTRAEARHWKNSETLFAAAVRAVPNSPRAQFTLGRIRLDQDRLDEALHRFEEAVRLWPTYSAAWLEKGTIHARRGQLAEAEAAFARAAELNPWDGRSHLSYGIALHRNGKIDAAEKQLRRTALRFPGNPQTAAELGHLYMRTGRPVEAARWYRRAVELGREDLLPALRRAESGSRSR